MSRQPPRKQLRQRTRLRRSRGGPQRPAEVAVDEPSEAEAADEPAGAEDEPKA